MKITLDKEFKSRAELDQYINSTVGSDSTKNTKHTLEVTEDEASTLGLSNKVKVFGVKISIKK